MIKQFLLLGFRNFLKHSTSAIINALGLSLAISCGLFTFSFIDFFYHVDDFHEHGKEIFAVNRTVKFENKEVIQGGAPEPIGRRLQSDLSQVIANSRLTDHSAYVRFGENVFEEKIRFVDPSFLAMFSFPVRSGNTNLLEDPDEVVISTKMAEKYFGDFNPLGENLELKFFINGKEHIEPFRITGVAEEFPKNANLRFNFLINFEKLQNLGRFQSPKWSTMVNASFIQLSNPDQINEVKSHADEHYLGIYQESAGEEEVLTYQFEPLLTSSLNSENIRKSIFSGTSIAAFITLSILTILLMVLACINYMNIAIASASYRLKEIGIRKVMGSDRKAIILQFLSENLLVCLMALGLGILWTESIFLPGFRSIATIPMANHYLSNQNLWLFLTAILLVSVAGGSGYPAFYISRYQPVTILKGSLKFGGNNKFRKLLLAMQYFFSFITIMAAIVLLLNDRYQYGINWGYGKENVVVIKVQGKDNFQKLANTITEESEVLSVAGSQHHLGRTIGDVFYNIGDKKYSAKRLEVGPDYLTTLKVPLLEGRYFDKNIRSDRDRSILINEKLKTTMGWDEALGQTVEIDQKNYEVIGVVDDFHYLPFYARIRPVVISMAHGENYQYLSARIASDDPKATAESLKSSWYTLFPNDPYNHYYQDAVFDNSFRDLDMVSRILSTIAFAAIFLAAIGLFGLAAIHMRSKIKEVSIRKVLGSNIIELGVLLNREFIILVLLASLLAIPVSYYAVDALLATLTRYPMPETYWPYLVTCLLLLVMSLLAVSSHVYKAVRTNPAEILRNE